MKKNLKWIICFISFMIFTILSILVLTKKDIYLDSYIYNIISKYITNNLTYIIKYLTDLGSAIAVILITIIVLIFSKNKKYGICMTIKMELLQILQLHKCY